MSESIARLPIFKMASSLKFNPETESRINSPLVALIVLPLIVILSTVSCPPVIVPVVVIADDPVSIEPKPLVIEPLFKAPVAVREEFTMLDPNVVAFKTDTLFILKTLPVGIFQS